MIRDVRRRRTRSARDFLAGLIDPIPAEADTVVLVVSELVTNALRHGGGSCTLDLTAHPENIEVAMHDRSPQAPRMRTRDLAEGAPQQGLVVGEQDADGLVAGVFGVFRGRGVRLPRSGRSSAWRVGFGGEGAGALSVVSLAAA